MVGISLLGFNFFLFPSCFVFPFCLLNAEWVDSVMIKLITLLACYQGRKSRCPFRCYGFRFRAEVALRKPSVAAEGTEVENLCI